MTDEPKYERGLIDWTVTGNVLTIQPHKAVATVIMRQGETAASISADGEITIDWHLVEQLANEPGPDRMASAVAKLMLAVRDQTYKGIWKPKG